MIGFEPSRSAAREVRHDLRVRGRASDYVKFSRVVCMHIEVGTLRKDPRAETPGDAATGQHDSRDQQMGSGVGAYDGQGRDHASL
ncbi:hypothetical protein SAMN04487980_1002155 [Streptomyces sp. cf124]|nr:hypothetical protein SAMN04487980_1002155 [Streptomyces sp. cf124]